MAYPNTFHRLVFLGTIYNDTWNTTLSICPQAGTGSLDLGSVSEEQIEDVADVISAWWTDDLPDSPGFSSDVNLTGIKLNRIGTNGRYADAESREFTYPSPLPGQGGGFHEPPQLAAVVTLETAVARGQASKGRQFWPVTSAWGGTNLGSDGRATAANAGYLASSAAILLRNLNTAYVGFRTGDEQLGKVSVASSSGAGLFRPVTSVRVGRAADTMRSRRSKLVEDYQQVIL